MDFRLKAHRRLLAGVVLPMLLCAPAWAQHDGAGAREGAAEAPLQHDTHADAAHAASDDVHGGSGGAHAEPNILAGDIGNIIFTLLIFLLVVWVLGRFAWNPLLKILQEREATIRDALETARQERAEADRVLAEYRRQIDHAREEATAIVEEGKRDAEAVRRRINEEARQEADRMIDRAKREIQLATDTAVKELYDQTARLAVDVAGNIIARELSPADHQKLVGESLERMKSSDASRVN